MRAISIINEIPSNKAGIKLFADALIQGVMDGNAEPLDMIAKVDSLERIMKAVKDSPEFKESVIDEADKYPENSFDLNGVKFTKSASAKYDYSHDKIWRELKDIEKGAAEDRKDREVMLKALKQPTEIDGVLCHPPVKSSSRYVRITFER